MSGLSSGEGLKWAVRDAVEAHEPLKDRGRIVGFQPVIRDHGVADKRLLVIESEFAQALKVMEREGNTLSPTLRQAWDSGNLRTLTKNDPVVATDAHVSILGHITREELTAQHEPQRLHQRLRQPVPLAGGQTQQTVAGRGSEN